MKMETLHNGTIIIYTSQISRKAASSDESRAEQETQYREVYQIIVNTRRQWLIILKAKLS